MIPLGISDQDLLTEQRFEPRVFHKFK
jgi:hypothetical protein